MAVVTAKRFVVRMGCKVLFDVEAVEEVMADGACVRFLLIVQLEVDSEMGRPRKPFATH